MKPTLFNTIAATAVGAQRELPLPDGSRVVLNTETEIAVAYTPAERRLELRRGEAHFIVTKDSARPFVVSVDGVAIRAVGTTFNIRRRGDTADVLVTEGRVRVLDVTGRITTAASPIRRP